MVLILYKSRKTLNPTSIVAFSVAKKYRNARLRMRLGKPQGDMYWFRPPALPTLERARELWYEVPTK